VAGQRFGRIFSGPGSIGGWAQRPGEPSWPLHSAACCAPCHCPRQLVSSTLSQSLIAAAGLAGAERGGQGEGHPIAIFFVVLSRAKAFPVSVLMMMSRAASPFALLFHLFYDKIESLPCVTVYSQVIGFCCQMRKALKLHARWSNTGSLSIYYY
jgi:hypothetical protein